MNAVGETVVEAAAESVGEIGLRTGRGVERLGGVSDAEESFAERPEAAELGKRDARAEQVGGLCAVKLDADDVGVVRTHGGHIEITGDGEPAIEFVGDGDIAAVEGEGAEIVGIGRADVRPGIAEEEIEGGTLLLGGGWGGAERGEQGGEEQLKSHKASERKDGREARESREGNGRGRDGRRSKA